MNQLFQDFSESNLNEWKQRLAKDLKGISFEDLSATDRNGITIAPFYTAENGTQKDTRFFASEWNICSRIIVTDATQANKTALKELAGGANALCFVIRDQVDYTLLLKDIDWQIIHIRFEYTGNNEAGENELKQLPSADLSRATFVYDPIGKGISTGITSEPDGEQLAAIVAHTGSITVCGTVYQNAGLNSSTELSYLLAHVNEYLNLLHRHDALKHIKQVNVSLACGTNFFEEIAKMRALRSLLESLAAEYGIEAAIYLHAETSDMYRSPFDAYSNMLRDTIAGMAAVLGGCSALSIHGFDQNSETQSAELSARMSRNQQLIFKEESYLNQVADISAGSFYLDELTEILADKAWTLFHDQEQQGGFLAALKDGSIAATVHTQQSGLLNEYKEGRRVLIGVNKYPNPDDKPHPVPATAGNGLFPLLNIPQALMQS
ncbi:methylmalonyl-CoA mutase family protein [Rurimicrobium arvi]|uniref:Methylmalonyl-CoA mutase subunit beta n=1 Tax=Rurimicrobium arvi TaxID=2049916 RepID=A0ABP8MP18_9BACT